MLIGLVGKSGAGKSSFVRRMAFFNTNVVHIDIDDVGKSILNNKEVLDNICKIIGDDSVVCNGVIDRKKVGNIIFNDKEKYDEYYRYTEVIEYKIIDDIIDNNKDKIVVLDWILLDNTKYWKNLDYKIFIDTDYEIRKKRVTSRDNISEEYFDLREGMKDQYNVNEMDFILDGNNINDEEIVNILGVLNDGR